jgi:hypothetical protein
VTERLFQRLQVHRGRHGRTAQCNIRTRRTTHSYVLHARAGLKPELLAHGKLGEEKHRRGLRGRGKRCYSTQPHRTKFALGSAPAKCKSLAGRAGPVQPGTLPGASGPQNRVLAVARPLQCINRRVTPSLDFDAARSLIVTPSRCWTGRRRSFRPPRFSKHRDQEHECNLQQELPRARLLRVDWQ